MEKKMKNSKLLTHLLMITLTVNLVACGTLLYPERKGTQSGKIDPLVAGLDAAGLLFYIIPGVIAFVVDYNSGAIYLPRGRSSAAESDVKVVRSRQAINNAYLESVLKDEVHVDADLQSDAVIAKKVTSLQSVEKEIALYQD
jgi:hypothetical protein